MRILDITGLKIFENNTELAIIVDFEPFKFDLYKRNKVTIERYTRMAIPDNHKYIRIVIEKGPLYIWINLMSKIGDDELEDYNYKSIIMNKDINETKELNDHKYNKNGERIDIDGKEYLTKNFDYLIPKIKGDYSGDYRELIKKINSDLKTFD